MPSEQLIEAVAVTAELCGRTFSAAAAAVFVSDLSGYPEQQVIGALRRCRREVRGMLTVQDVVSRLEDGRPGADEAWAMIPHDESGSVVWSQEMAEAWGIAAPLIAEGDKVGGRMAFREAYARLCAAARDRCEPVRWAPSMGHDPRGREDALRVAVEAGRITHEHAQSLTPALQTPTLALLTGPDAAGMPPGIRERLQAAGLALRGKVAA